MNQMRLNWFVLYCNRAIFVDETSTRIFKYIVKRKKDRIMEEKDLNQLIRWDLSGCLVYI